MAQLMKIPVLWNGFAGAPGYSVFYRNTTTIATAEIRTFYDSVKALLPATVDINVPNSGDLVDEATGELAGTWNTAANAIVAGTSVAGYAAPVGAVVRWLTAGINNGRRVRGRTFLVPGAAGMQQSDGTLLGTAQATLQAAASALVTADGAALGVWHRPVNGAGGAFHLMTAADVPDRMAVLRSRRD